MRVQRTKHLRAFVQISNDIARHSRLSLEAVGLLVRLLSLPETNGATVDKITAKVPNGRRSVSKAMNELIAEGFVSRAKLQDPETGLWVTITTVTDAPTDHMPTVGVPAPRSVDAYPKGKDAKRKTSPLAPESEQRPEGRADSEEGEESPQGTTVQTTAAAALGRLGSVEPRLRLSVSEVMRLAPLAAQWLSEGFSEPKMIKALTRALPVSIDSAAALVSYRLKNHRPEDETPAPVVQAVDHRARCQGCEAVFPAGREAELCRLCEDEMARAVAHLTDAPVQDMHQEARQTATAGASLVRSQIIRK